MELPIKHQLKDPVLGVLNHRGHECWESEEDIILPHFGQIGFLIPWDEAAYMEEVDAGRAEPIEYGDPVPPLESQRDELIHLPSRIDDHFDREVWEMIRDFCENSCGLGSITAEEVQNRVQLWKVRAPNGGIELVFDPDFDVDQYLMVFCYSGNPESIFFGNPYQNFDDF